MTSDWPWFIHFRQRMSDFWWFWQKRYVRVYKSCQIDKLFLIQVTILKILKILNFYPFYLFYSEVEGKYLDLSHFHYNPAEFVLTWQIQTSYAYVIWISRTWFLSIKIIKNFMIFMNFQEYTRGKNHVYSWIEISCWDGFSGFCPKMQIFIIFDDFSMNLAHFALGRWFFWWILWIFAFWLGLKLSHQPAKKYLEIRLSCQRSNFNLRLSQFGKNL